MSADSFTLNWKTPFTLQWTLTDASGAGITGAVVTANLYLGRSRVYPDRKPGFLVTSMSALSLADKGAGLYEVDVEGGAIPVPGSDYVMVIEATLAGTVIDHSEPPTAVLVEI